MVALHGAAELTCLQGLGAASAPSALPGQDAPTILSCAFLGQRLTPRARAARGGQIGVVTEGSLFIRTPAADLSDCGSIGFRCAIACRAVDSDTERHH